VKIRCAITIFHSAIKRKCAYLSFKNSIPLQLTSSQCSLFRLWQLKNEEIQAFVYIIAQFTNVQSIHPGFFTSEKRITMDDDQKKFIPQLAIFFIAHLSILVRCKTKGAVGEVCATLRIWPLGA
jgi:hypothetical protein